MNFMCKKFDNKKNSRETEIQLDLVTIQDGLEWQGMKTNNV